MKIVNEKGKLFGLINVVDLLALLALLVVIGGVGFRLISAKIEEAGVTETELTAVVRVRGANEHVQKILMDNDQVGKTTISGTEFLEDSYIADVQFEDYYQQVATDDGKIVNALDPVKKDIVFTIKGIVEHDDGPIVRWGVQDMRPGRNCTIKTTDIELIGMITDMHLADEDEEEDDETSNANATDGKAEDAG